MLIIFLSLPFSCPSSASFHISSGFSKIILFLVLLWSIYPKQWKPSWVRRFMESQDVDYCSASFIADTGFRCTDYSSNEDWSVGENNFTHTFSSSYSTWIVRYVPSYNLTFYFKFVLWINIIIIKFHFAFAIMKLKSFIALTFVTNFAVLWEFRNACLVR